MMPIYKSEKKRKQIFYHMFTFISGGITHGIVTGKRKCRKRELNRGPLDLKSSNLPNEL